MSQVSKVIPQDFSNEVENAAGRILVDFYADWCGPCKMIAPALETVAEESTELKVVKVDADEAQDIMIKYGIRGIPTLLLFEDGKVIASKVGAMSVTALREFVAS